MPIRIPMKQSAPERHSSLSKKLFPLLVALSFLNSSVTSAQMTTQVDPVSATGTGTAFGTSGAAINPDIINQGAYDMATQQYNAAVVQQNAATLASQQAYAAQQAALAQQAAHNPAAQPVNNTGSMIAICGSLLSSLSGGLNPKAMDSNKKFTKALDDYNEAQGNQPDPDVKPEVAKRVAAESYSPAAVMKYGASAGLCPDFFDKQGNVGPLGRLVESEMDKYPNSYEDKNLKDLNEMCPKYNSMEKGTKKLFWVRFFSILANKESSCNPKNDNHSSPNGTAYGLFQLDKPTCGDIDLHNPNDNTRCAVKRMAKEMSIRSTLSTPCSNPEACRRHGVNSAQGTYWGELRNDDNNKGRGADTGAAIGLRRAVSSYSECH
jgi:hypothetical protein